MARSVPKWVHLGSNQGPSGYEPDALTAELWTRGARTSVQFGSIPFTSLGLGRGLARKEFVPPLHQYPGQLGRPAGIGDRSAPLPWTPSPALQSQLCRALAGERECRPEGRRKPVENSLRGFGKKGTSERGVGVAHLRQASAIVLRLPRRESRLPEELVVAVEQRKLVRAIGEIELR